jgi:hypothetical protein
MTVRNVCGVLQVLAFTCGVMTAGQVYAQRRDGNLLPQEQSGMITAAGCLLRGNQVRGGDADNYALANPRKGPVSSVPQGTCTADAGAAALDLKDGKQNGITDAMVGRWVEVSGELEKETSRNPDELRELDVRSAKLVPVVPPRVEAAAAPAPRPTPPPVAAASSAPAPVTPALAPATLPKTASNVPATGLFGFLMLAAAVVLRSVRLRHAR